MIIKDERLEPYEIRHEGASYTVYENRISKKNKPTTTVHGYFSSVPNALIKIIKLKTQDDNTYSLEEYAEKLSEMTNEIKELLTIKLS